MTSRDPSQWKQYALERLHADRMTPMMISQFQHQQQHQQQLLQTGGEGGPPPDEASPSPPPPPPPGPPDSTTSSSPIPPTDSSARSTVIDPSFFYSHFIVPPELNDAGNQTEYGTTDTKASATIVTTADLQKLIPIPDQATLLRSTIESLKQSERKATELLHHIQRELSLQLQEAGLSYGASTMDDIHEQSRFDTENNSTRVGFSQRRQLTFAQSTTMQEKAAQRAATQDAAARDKRYWQFAVDSNSFQLYTQDTAKRATVMNQLEESVVQRHKTYDEIQNSLDEQAMAQSTRLTAAILKKESQSPRFRLGK